MTQGTTDPGAPSPARPMAARPAAARPAAAATVVLMRPAGGGFEVLLTRRPATMAFGPDIHVFPGGRVEAADREAAARGVAGLTAESAARNLGLGLAPDDGMTPALALAHHLAAARETAEETGIRVRPADLVALTRWVTPPSLPRRFDVRFFGAFVPAGSEPEADSTEVVDATWLSPGAALAAAASGRIELWQPTFVTLQQLVGRDDEAMVRAAFAPGPTAGGPIIEPTGRAALRVDAAWAGGIPGRRAGGRLIGERELVVVDPADPTGVTTDAILAEAAARGTRLGGVAISSLAPECHAGVEMLAHGLGLPVAAARGTVAWRPYPVVEVDPNEPLPFGDPGLTLAGALSGVAGPG